MRFESSVISYGSKTMDRSESLASRFESSVISYGSKTFHVSMSLLAEFESSVISYGSKTVIHPSCGRFSLRVV